MKWKSQIKLSKNSSYIKLKWNNTKMNKKLQVIGRYIKAWVSSSSVRQNERMKGQWWPQGVEETPRERRNYMVCSEESSLITERERERWEYGRSKWNWQLGEIWLLFTWIIWVLNLFSSCFSSFPLKNCHINMQLTNEKDFLKKKISHKKSIIYFFY